MNAYPKWFLPLLLVSLIGVAISGLLLIPTTLDTKFEQDVPWRLMGDPQLAVIFLHSLSAYLIMIFIGALSTIHMRAGLRRRENLRSGLFLLMLFLLLMVTALGLLYFADEALVLWSSLLHTAAGGDCGGRFRVAFCGGQVDGTISKILMAFRG